MQAEIPVQMQPPFGVRLAVATERLATELAEAIAIDGDLCVPGGPLVPVDGVEDEEFPEDETRPAWEVNGDE